jgi:hypothetical protein
MTSWARILKDYSVRQVIFEVKNYSEPLSADEYRQMASYLCDNYGKLGFIINRSQDWTLQRGSELDWAKELYDKHDKLVIKINGRFLANLLSKLRSPQKHDVVDDALNGLLDTYERRYFSQLSGRRVGR